MVKNYMWLVAAIFNSTYLKLQRPLEFKDLDFSLESNAN